MVIAGIFFLLVSFNTTFREKFIVKKQAEALLNGERITTGGKVVRKRRAHQGKIRNKFMIFCLSLVLIITIGSGTLITHRVTSLETENLADDLRERLSLLGLSILTGVKYYMPAQRILEINSVCNLADYVPEVESVTILGPQLDLYDNSEGDNFDYVWYSNSEFIANNVDDIDSDFGYMRYVSDSIDVGKILGDANKIVTENVYPLVSQQDFKARRIVKLSETADSSYAEELNQLQNEYFVLEEEIAKKLDEYTHSFGGYYPESFVSSLDFDEEEYIYYHPILYRQANSSNYIHGLIVIRFSTELLKNSIAVEQRKITTLSLIFALVANVIALVGAFLMATIITKPIKELENHLRRIGLSRDRTKLDKLQIHITSKDEIGRLGQIVNEMTKQLGVAAKEEQLLVDAKAIQQAFLPLTVMESGIKRNIANKKSDSIDFFGYFEGAATVSGDYFDYKRLDKDWHVVVKCDASGHGFAAAIIMTIIATLFRNYFSQWSYEKNGIGINHFVNQVNQFISSLNIDGRFASMLVCLVNSKTGELYMCNAGDNLVHIYDGTLKKIKTVELFSSPVVGPFNPVLINQMGGFKVEKIILKPGDMLLLYTDGIEESFRTCRNSNYDPVMIEGDIPGTKKPKLESFGQRNILKIVEAVMNHDVFVLEKMDNPNENEVLEFNFTGCPGTTEDVVTAVVAIEKVFRMFKPASALRTDYISVDKQIDLFLKKYFNLYNEYCLDKTESSEDYVFSNYIDYEYLMEDEQKDDLTLFVMKYR